jgi:hypothetical protein
VTSLYEKGRAKLLSTEQAAACHLAGDDLDRDRSTGAAGRLYAP